MSRYVFQSGNLDNDDNDDDDGNDDEDDEDDVTASFREERCFLRSKRDRYRETFHTAKDNIGDYEN